MTCRGSAVARLWLGPSGGGWPVPGSELPAPTAPSSLRRIQAPRQLYSECGAPVRLSAVRIAGIQAQMLCRCSLAIRSY